MVNTSNRRPKCVRVQMGSRIISSGKGLCQLVLRTVTVKLKKKKKNENDGKGE